MPNPRSPMPDSAAFIPCAAHVLADYSEQAALASLRAWKDVAPQHDLVTAWWGDVDALRQQPSAVAIWRHLALAMHAVNQISPQIFRYAGMRDEHFEPHRAAHLENLAKFDAAVAAAEAGRSPAGGRCCGVGGDWPR